MEWYMELEFIFLIFFVFIAHTAQTITGFGSTIIAVTLGSIFYEINYLIPLLVPVNYMLVIYILARHYEGIQTRLLVRKMLPLFLAGIPIGFMIFYLGPGIWLKILFGGFVVIISTLELYSILSPKPIENKAPSKPYTFFMLITAGIIHGIYASGGPVVVFYLNKVIADKKAFRSTLSVLWIITGAILIISYIISGSLRFDQLEKSVFLLIPLVAGITFGEWLYKKINEQTFKVFVMVLLIISGGLTVVNALLK